MKGKFRYVRVGAGYPIRYEVYLRETDEFLGVIRKVEERYNLRRAFAVRGWKIAGEQFGVKRTRDAASEELLSRKGQS